MATVIFECPHCLAERMSFQHLATSSWHDSISNSFFSFLHLQCRGCGKPVAAEVSNGGNAAMSDFTANHIPLEATGFWVDKVWPSPSKPAVPTNLPNAVARAYFAAERNFPHEGMEEAAAGSYGRALDIGTLAFAPELPEKMPLFARIEKLAESHRITPELAKWAHEIRLIRNDALHKPHDLTRDELIAIRGFAEMVLTYLFTLPGMLTARQAQTSMKPTP